MTPAQMETFRGAMNIRAGRGVGRVRRPARNPPTDIQAFLDRVPFARAGERALQRAAHRRAG